MSDIKRKGFAMILAIFIIVMIAVGGTILLKNAAVGSKSIGDNYLHAQAELLAQSATEFALMRAQGVAVGECLKQLNITVNDASGSQMFDISVSLAYTFRGAAPAACTALGTTLASNTGKDTMVLMDVMVTDHNVSTEEVRVQKRSWQKL